MFFLDTGSPAKSLSTKTVILSTCSCLRIRVAAFGFPTRYLAARFSGTMSNSCGSLILRAKKSAVSARFSLSRANYDSRTQADLYRVASSFFRIGLFLPSNTTLTCNVPRGVLAASVFALHPDSLTMCDAWRRSGSVSKKCQVSSVTTLNTRCYNRRRLAPESSNPSVSPCQLLCIVI